MSKCGLKTKRAKKSVLTGINAVKNRLKVQMNGRPRLRIHYRCEHLINEMYEYEWEKSVGGLNAREVPKKTNDHAQDALRYMVMSLDGAPGAGFVG